MFGLSAIGARVVEYAVLMLALLAGYGWWSHSLKAEGAAACRAEQLQADQTEERRRVAAQGEINAESQRMAARAASDRDRAAESRARLLHRAESIVVGCSPAATVISPPTENPAGVLAELLRRADERAGLLADYADRARVAGEACERAYDSLTR